MQTVERFMAKVTVGLPGECWVWTGCTTANGYGRFRFKGQTRNAHRVAYLLFVGPIPDDMDVDHLCRHRGCVNPAHLEPVTRKTNVLRGIGHAARNARKAACLRGHPLSGKNLVIWTDQRGRSHRRCLTCFRQRTARYLARPDVRASRRAYYRNYNRTRRSA